MAGLCLQTWREELGNCEDAVQVQSKNTSPRGVGVLVEGGSPIGAGVIDENVEVVLTLLEFFSETLAVLQLVEIGGDSMSRSRALMVRDVSKWRQMTDVM